MPALAEPPSCRRCRRAVEISQNQYDTFEQMHYVCFHYEFEHDPVDPDEECAAGGCPSAAINPRPERRPGPQPPRHDHVLGSGWIWLDHLRRFLELTSHYVRYDFGDSDWLAIQAGLDALHGETDTFTYRIIGQLPLTITLAKNPDGDEVTLTIISRADQPLATRIATLIDAYSS
jgi:hypothetical protein